ncbi:MAG TPA: hypothetical protein VHV31_00945, partial [Nitrolancea sp.]|nr:hypothetical protein [Nitrolancea sp.]
KSILRGLANLNANSLQFKGGAGTLALDFDGTLQRDLDVSVSAAAGNVVVSMPQGVPAAATISGVLTSVSTHGAWTKSHRQYVTSGSGSSITLDFKMSVGNLELRSL